MRLWTGKNSDSFEFNIKREAVNSRGVFRTQSKIYGGAFSENS